MPKVSNIFKLTWFQSRCALTGTLTVLFLCAYYVECFIVGPIYFNYGSLSYNILFALATFCSFNFLFNLMAMVFCDPSTRPLILSQPGNTYWSYCQKCESIRPPRAHHCRRCDVCILRFDHHCIFLAQCVGHRNIASFLHLLIHISIICIMTTCFNLPYVFSFITNDWRLWQRALCLMNPIPFFLLTWLSPLDFLMCMFSSMCFVLGPTFTIFFVHHFSQVCRNVTTLEVALSTSRHHGQICYEDELRPMDYNLGWRKNISQTLGRRWLLTFFLPFLDSLHISDGLNFPPGSRSTSNLLDL